MKELIHIVGARPNFMKAAAVTSALANERSFNQFIVHTGQHYDREMSDVFFDELAIPQPDINLGVVAATPISQCAEIMSRLEELFSSRRPHIVLLYGDVTSTAAAALVCSHKGIPFAHVEAGLRSHDMSMPEEINRIVTDRLADFHFTPSQDGDANLLKEGIRPDQIFFVGNVMIDTLLRILPLAKLREESVLRQVGLVPGADFVLMTLHRPATVDVDERLTGILNAVGKYAKGLPVIFPVHPRTRKKLEQLNFEMPRSIRLFPAMGYIEFLALQTRAKLILTDSGGVQEESTYLGIPCLTLRENTERPVTVTIGTNKLVGYDLDRLGEEFTASLTLVPGEVRRPDLWDGHAGERIVVVLKKIV